MCYPLQHKFASGGFCEVWRSEHPLSNQPLAIKLIQSHKENQPNARDHLRTEIKVLQQLDHPNIVKLVDIVTVQGSEAKGERVVVSSVASEENSVVAKLHHQQRQASDKLKDVVAAKTGLVLEFCPKGELWDYLRLTGRMESVLARTVFKKILSAVKYCQELGIFHHDIKPEQVVFDDDFDVKLTDFGLALQFPSSSSSSSSPSSYPSGHFLASTRTGTREYHAPEIELTTNDYDIAAAEVWACGLTLFFMLFGFPAFNHVSFNDPWFADLFQGSKSRYWEKIVRHVQGTTEFASDSIPSEALDLLRLMLAVDPADRPTLGEVLRHPWMKGPVYSAEEMAAHMSLRLARLNAEKAKGK